jgi:cellulose synthase/poly-beta-1,6-N-acetylglucosamine synthase-like glycosyltransferase
MISLIISFYKRIDFLELIFQSLDQQSFRDFEVIIAEDASDPATVDFVCESKYRHDFPIKHVSQEDIGFRKTRILNSAVRHSAGELLVFIDGDCVLHRHFLREYSKSIGNDHFCYGRRVFCSEKHTRHLLNSRSVKECNTLRSLFYGGSSIGAGIYIPFKIFRDKQHRRILGCNWGILKKNFMAVNGFDEDYNRAGVGEDFDIDWRLKKHGLKVRSMKGRAIMYHLYHKPNYYPADTEFVEKLMEEKKLTGNAFCLNGIIKNLYQN